MRSGTPPGSASSGEADHYFAPAEELRLLGCQVAKAPTTEYAGIPVSLGPRVVLAPSYALTFRCVRRRDFEGAVCLFVCLCVCA